MPKDVLITPANSFIELKDVNSNVDAMIYLDNSRNLNIINPNGQMVLGNTAGNIFIGDGAATVDIVFEQNGSIRALTGKTLTLGQSDSFVFFASNISNGLRVTSGNVGIGTTSPSSTLHVVGNANITAGINTTTINVTTANVSAFARLNVVTANITTVETGNTLTLQTGTGSNANLVISANGAEKLRITNSGNIIIQRTGASTQNVSYLSDATGHVLAFNHDPTNPKDILFQANTGNNWFGSPAAVLPKFIFSVTGNNIATIANTGLGVYTTAPTSNLHVVGNANITTGINTATVNATTVNAATFITSTGANVFLTAINAYAAANAAANTVRVSQNSSLTLSSKQLNFVNTETVTINVTDAGNGNANISFISAAGGEGIIATDVFTGTGACTQFGLSQDVDTEHTFVFLNGVSQKPFVDYNVTGFVLTMNTAPALNTKVEARTLQKVTLTELRQSRVFSDVFNGTGACTEFYLTQSTSSSRTLVHIDGVAQVPTVDYNIVADKLTFINPPLSGTVIEARSFTEFAAANSTGIVSVTATGTGACTVYSITANSTTKGTFVFVDGVVQVPVVDYSVSNNVVTFTSPPENNAVIEFRSLYDLNFTEPTSGIANIGGTYTVTSTNLQYENGNFASVGDSIAKTYILRGTTTNATETELFINANLRIPVSTNTTVFYTADIVARRTDVTGESAGFHIKGVVDNFSDTTADVGSLYEVVVAEDDTGLAVDAAANNTTDTINILVTGVAGKTYRWTALVNTVEVKN